MMDKKISAAGRAMMMALTLAATAMTTNSAKAVQSQAVKVAPAIQAFEPGSPQEIIASQKGKPFVLIVWSLDCEYCYASMKTLAQERRKRPTLRVVTLATDSLADPQALDLMRNKLASVDLTSHAWAYGEAPPEQLRYALDPAWYGEKPRSYWFDGRGGRKAYSGVITPAVIERMMGRN